VLDLTGGRNSVPTYQYACTECGHAFDQVQAFSDDALTVCPACSGRLRKVFNAVGVVFKGSGFYRTDSRSAADRSAAAKESRPAAAEKSGTEKSGTEKSGTEKSGTEKSAPAKSREKSSGDKPSKAPAAAGATSAG
jgi:putative FmdB family regulatory protein